MKEKSITGRKSNEFQKKPTVVMTIGTHEGEAKRVAKEIALKREAINTIQQTSTKSTSVESVDFKTRNRQNKYKSRRGFIDKEKYSLGTPFTHNAVQIGRNDPCHCGSGIKFKKCHLVKQVMQKR